MTLDIPCRSRESVRARLWHVLVDRADMAKRDSSVRAFPRSSNVEVSGYADQVRRGVARRARILAVAAAGQCGTREADRYPTSLSTTSSSGIRVVSPTGRPAPAAPPREDARAEDRHRLQGRRRRRRGWSQFVRSRADGYNIVGTNLPTIVTQPILQDVGYLTDQFLPICDFQYTPLILATKKGSPYKTLQDFITAAKANPGKLSIGGVALWSVTHIMALNFMKDAGIQTQFVPHTGTASLMSNILGGHVDVGIPYSDDMVRMQDQIQRLAIAPRSASRAGRMSRPLGSRASITTRASRAESHSRPARRTTPSRSWKKRSSRSPTAPRWSPR